MDPTTSAFLNGQQRQRQDVFDSLDIDRTRPSAIALIRYVVGASLFTVHDAFAAYTVTFRNADHIHRRRARPYRRLKRIPTIPFRFSRRRGSRRRCIAGENTRRRLPQLPDAVYDPGALVVALPGELAPSSSCITLNWPRQIITRWRSVLLPDTSIPRLATQGNEGGVLTAPLGEPLPSPSTPASNPGTDATDDLAGVPTLRRPYPFSCRSADARSLSYPTVGCPAALLLSLLTPPRPRDAPDKPTACRACTVDGERDQRRLLLAPGELSQ